MYKLVLEFNLQNPDNKKAIWATCNSFLILTRFSLGANPLKIRMIPSNIVEKRLGLNWVKEGRYGEALG
jgi:hypothetical protein